MLEADTADALLRLAHTYLARELEIIQLRSKIATEAQSEMDKSQRDYILRQQMKAIQKELGEDEGGERAEAEMLRERLAQANLPEEVRTPTLNMCSSCPGRSLPKTNWISTRRVGFLMKTTTVSKTLRNASSSFSP